MTAMDATIIVVEDKTDARVPLCRALEEAGYKVIGLRKGTDALGIIGRSRFNVVITEIGLPDVSGLDILELAKEMNPDAAVIVMTDHAGVEVAVDAVKDGAYGYFVKPVNPEELKTAIANALKQQGLLIENKRLVENLQHSRRLLSEANEKLQLEIAERKRMELELQAKNAQLVAQQQELIQKTRELEVASQAKSEFLAHMSHELRTPLNVIMGFSELMLDQVPGEINEEQRQCLDDMLTSSRDLLGLINEVLDLSKVEAGKVELRLKNIALSDVVGSVTSAMMAVISQRRQSLDVDLDGGLPSLHADEARLRQVFFNLLSNASKFTPDGGEIKIKASRKDNFCQVSVSDNGIGIKEEDLKQIFEPFYQADNLETRERRGTGLGLTLVQEIVEMHGGQIWVESKYGKGSNFIFTLPLVAAEGTGAEEDTDCGR